MQYQHVLQHRWFFVFFFVWDTSFLSGFKHTLVKTTLGTAHIQNHAASEARALAGWIPYSQFPQLVPPSFEPQTLRHSKRHAVIVCSFEEPPIGFSSQATITEHRGSSWEQFRPPNNDSVHQVLVPLVPFVVCCCCCFHACAIWSSLDIFAADSSSAGKT
jgi:hypothetical protein